MKQHASRNIEQIKASHRKAADQLCRNSRLAYVSSRF